MQSLWQDARCALRTLRKSPGFSAVVILTLALGIGANTAIFSAINSFLLSSLPYEDPGRIVVFRERHAGGGSRHINSPADFLDWRDRSRSFSEVCALRFWFFSVTGTGEPEELHGFLVSPGFFRLLGVRPELGRTFRSEEEERGRHRVVVISQGLWKRRFGKDPAIVGRTLTINQEPYVVVGVLPESFRFARNLGKEIELWMPLAFSEDELTRGVLSIGTYGKLKRDVTLQRAQAEMERISAELAEEHPAENRDWTVRLARLEETSVDELRPVLLLLLVAVGLVLLIACSNVANLLVARATVRRGEIALRTALGAPRWRIVRQLLAESALLSALGGTLGLALVLYGVDGLRSLLSAYSISTVIDFAIDYRVFFFTLLLSLATGVGFGLLPALEASKVDVQSSLKQGPRTAGTDRGRRRIQNALVVAQVALSLTLLVGAALLIESLLHLRLLDRGLDTEGVVAAQIRLPKARYREPHERIGFFKRLLQQVRARPDVESASLVSFLPLIDGYFVAEPLAVEGQPPPEPGEERYAQYSVVDAEYFRTMGIPLLEGRDFDAGDSEEAPAVAIVNAGLARLLWPGESAIGRRIRFQIPDVDLPWQARVRSSWLTVVGVAGDVRGDGIMNDYWVANNHAVYLPYRQNPSDMLNLVVESRVGPASLAPRLEEEVRRIDPDQPVALVRAMEEVLERSLSDRNTPAVLLATFAGVALLLASLGIYSVMAYTVAQRRQEFGIRIALGATRSRILWMVVRHAGRLLVVGAVVGVATSLIAARLVQSLLYGVSSWDPLTFAGVTALLGLVGIAACLLPAYRATRVDPGATLRYE